MIYCNDCKHESVNGGDEIACENCSVWDESWNKEYDTHFNYEPMEEKDDQFK